MASSYCELVYQQNNKIAIFRKRLSMWVIEQKKFYFKMSHMRPELQQPARSFLGKKKQKIVTNSF